MTLVVPLLVALQAAVSAPSANAGGSGGSVTSTDGRITATKTASTYSLPVGGGQVAYTYTVNNNTSSAEYFVGASDDQCGTPSSSGLSYDLFGAWYYIPGGATVTFTCSQTVTVTTTNTATFTFNTACGWLFGCTGAPSDVAVKATVDVQIPTYTCDTIWYGSMASGSTPGSIGTVLPSQQKVAAVSPPGQTSSYASTSAIAINPHDPGYVYYTARSGSTFLSNLYRVNLATGVQELVASGSSAFQTNRLGFDSSGAVWSFANDGRLYSWTAAGGVSAGKTATFPDGNGGTLNPASLTSGDLAFDGLGNMWVLVSTGSGSGITPTTYLYTISAAQLATGTPQATLVGVMTSPGGNMFYNGLAFDTNGTLYATTNNGSTSYLYTVDKDTGATTQTTSYSSGTYGNAADLASCALPKPQIVAQKTVSPPGPAKVGDTLTYTITVNNIGSLSATGMTFQDSIPAGTDYVPGSATLNGSAVADVNGAMPYVTAQPINGSTTSFKGVLPAGDTATIAFKVKVNSAALAAGEVRNQGTVVYVGPPPIPTDDPTKPGGSDPTVTPILNPAIAVKKTASTTTVNVSGPVTYTYQVTLGAGTEPLKNVALADDKCPNPVYVSGDANNNRILDPGETWTYTCTQTLGTTTTNTATASGVGVVTGTPVSSTAQATVTITNPNLNLAKSAGTASGPDASGNYTANYTLTVANTGTGQGTYGPITDTPAFAPNLAVTGASWSGQATGTATGPGPFTIGTGGTTINPGQTQTYALTLTFRYTNFTQATACAGLGSALYNSASLPAGQEQGTTTDNAACIPPPAPPTPGTITWQKVDAATPSDYLGGSVWTLRGPGASGPTVTVTDCAATPCTGTNDTDARAGYLSVGGLAWGTYTLTETKAPAGYVLNTTPRTVTIGATALTANLGAIKNTQQTVPVLPLTGGIGADTYLIAGGLITVLALGLASLPLWRRRRPNDTP